MNLEGRAFTLADDELEAIHDVIYNEAYYGDDEVVYGNGAHAVALRRALAKVEDEAKGRKRWWIS